MFVVLKILRNIRLTSLVGRVTDAKTDCWPNLYKKRPNSCCILVLMYRFGSKFNVKANSKYILSFE